MTGAGLRSAVIVAVDEAASVVDGWRERTCVDKPSRGVPPHVTLLFPFVPASALGEALEAELTAVVAAAPAFGMRFGATARFPGTLYLTPEPARPFILLTGAIARRFPGYPPYEGAFEAVVPHLTVAQGDDPPLDEAEADVVRSLPIRSRVREALLLEEVEPDGARWRVRSRLALGPKPETVSCRGTKQFRALPRRGSEKP